MKNKLFPIEFDGKVYNEEDCDAEFLDNYTDRNMLLGGMILLYGETYLTPDGFEIEL